MNFSRELCRALALLGLVLPTLGRAARARAGAIELEAGRVENEASPPAIDGLVTEDAWTRVEPYTGFVQQNPYEGEPASERTEIRVLLGKRTLYIGVIEFDSEPESILITDPICTSSRFIGGVGSRSRVARVEPYPTVTAFSKDGLTPPHDAYLTPIRSARQL